MNNYDKFVDGSIVVLLDQFTKSTVETIEYDSISKHALIITDIKELNDSNCNSTLIIFEPSLFVISIENILEEIINELSINVILVYKNKDNECVLKNIANSIMADYSIISWPFIYALANNDLAILGPYQDSEKIIDEFKSIKDRVPSDMREYLDRFRAGYLGLLSKCNDVVEGNSVLKESMKIQEAIGRRTINGILELKNLLDEAQNKINSYEALLSESYSDKFTGFYPSKPRIIYIKRISHLSGIDTFLSILFSVLTQQYKMSCKVIKLVDDSNSLDIRYIPNNYVTVPTTYNTGDIIINDFIVKLGSYRLMYDDLLLNRSGLDFLIVHDMRNDINISLDDTLIDLRINEISSDYAVLGEYDNMLSDYDRNVLYPWSFSECRKYTGTKTVVLVNHPTIVSILNNLF